MLDYNRMIATWNEFIQEFPDAIDLEEFDLLAEIAYIKKDGDKWCVYSESGRKFGCYASKKKAEERLIQIEMFKHMKSAEKGAEFAKQECYCPDCGKEFFVKTMCHLERCKYCGGDDLEEITGEL
jgi:hypothetical protein